MRAATVEEIAYLLLGNVSVDEILERFPNTSDWYVESMAWINKGCSDDQVCATRPAGMSGPSALNETAHMRQALAQAKAGVMPYGHFTAMDDVVPTALNPVSFCSYCKKESTHAKEETSRGLCYECWEARR